MPRCSRTAAGAEFAVLVAGISETTGPMAYLLASHNRYGKAWRVADITAMEVALMPSNSETLRIVQDAVFRGRSVGD